MSLKGFWKDNGLEKPQRFLSIPLRDGIQWHVGKTRISQSNEGQEAPWSQARGWDPKGLLPWGVPEDVPGEARGSVVALSRHLLGWRRGRRSPQ